MTGTERHRATQPAVPPAALPATRPARFLSVPIDLYIEMQMYNDAVGRDLLLVLQERRTPELRTRLAGLLGIGFERLADVRAVLREQIEQARAEGRTHVDIGASYVPADVTMALEYFALVEEADRLVDRGLIMAPAPRPEVDRLRRWFMRELDTQVRRGEAPRPFDPGEDDAAYESR